MRPSQTKFQKSHDVGAGWRFKKKECRVGAALGDNREATVSSAAVIRKQRPQYGATRDGTEAPKTLSSGNFAAKHRSRYTLVPCANQRWSKSLLFAACTFVEEYRFFVNLR